MTNEELTNEELAVLVKNGNREHLNTLCERLQPLVRKIAKQFNSTGLREDQEDIEQALFEQLCIIIPRFDPNRNAKVITFILPWLRQSAQRCRQQLHPLKIPGDVVRRLYLYRSLVDQGLSQKEISRITGIPPKLLADLKKYDLLLAPPLSMSSEYVTDDGTELTLEDTLVDAEAEKAFQNILDCMVDSEIECYILSLPEPFRTVLMERFMKDTKTPLNELAERLNISLSEVRKAQRKGLKLIEKEFRKRGIIERISYGSTGYGRMERSFTSNVEQAVLEILGEA